MTCMTEMRHTPTINKAMMKGKALCAINRQQTTQIKHRHEPMGCFRFTLVQINECLAAKVFLLTETQELSLIGRVHYLIYPKKVFL